MAEKEANPTPSGESSEKSGNLCNHNLKMMQINNRISIDYICVTFIEWNSVIDKNEIDEMSTVMS